MDEFKDSSRKALLHDWEMKRFDVNFNDDSSSNYYMQLNWYSYLVIMFKLLSHFLCKI